MVGDGGAGADDDVVQLQGCCEWRRRDGNQGWLVTCWTWRAVKKFGGLTGMANLIDDLGIKEAGDGGCNMMRD